MKIFFRKYYNAIMPMLAVVLVFAGLIAMGRDNAMAQTPNPGPPSSNSICTAGEPICNESFQASGSGNMGVDPCGGKYCFKVHGYKTRVEATKIMFERAQSGAWGYPYVCSGGGMLNAGFNLWLAEDECRVTNSPNSQLVNTLSSGSRYYGESYAWRCQFLANDCFGSIMSAYILAIKKSCEENLAQNPCKDFLRYLDSNYSHEYPRFVTGKDGVTRVVDADLWLSKLNTLPRSLSEAIGMYQYVNSRFMHGGPQGGNCIGGGGPLGNKLSPNAKSGSVMSMGSKTDPVHWGMILGQDACGNTFQIESNWASYFSCYSKATGLQRNGFCNNQKCTNGSCVGYGDGGVGINHPGANDFYNNGSAWNTCYGGAPRYADGSTDPEVTEYLIPDSSCGPQSPTEKMVKGNINSPTCDVYHKPKETVTPPKFNIFRTTQIIEQANIPSCGWPQFQLSNTIGSRESIGGVKPTENVGSGFNSDSYRRKKTDVVNPAAVFAGNSSKGYNNSLYNSYCYWIPTLASRAVDSPNGGFAPMYNFAVTPPARIGDLTYNESMAALKRQRDTCIYNLNSYTAPASKVPECNPKDLLDKNKRGACWGVVAGGAADISYCEKRYAEQKDKYDAQAIAIFKAGLKKFAMQVNNPQIALGFDSCNSEKDAGKFIDCYKQRKGCDGLVDYGSDVMDDYIDLGCNDSKEVASGAVGADGTKPLDLGAETAENMINYLMCSGYNLVTGANLSCPCDYNNNPKCPFPKLLPGLKASTVSRNTKACVDATIRKQRSVEPSSVAFRNTMLVDLEDDNIMNPESYAKKYCQPLDEKYVNMYKNALPKTPMGYCPSTIAEMKKAYASNEPDLSDYKSFKDTTTQKYLAPYVERILEPEPSALSVHSHRYYVKQKHEEDFVYPDRDPVLMNEIGSLCRPYIIPDEIEAPETRWNEAKGNIGGEFDFDNFKPSKMYPQTDHSDGFSPRHQEAKYELKQPKYAEPWHQDAEGKGHDYVQSWYPQCFMCNTSHSGYRRKNTVTPMQWNHRKYKNCVDCLRYCLYKAVKYKLRDCTTGDPSLCRPGETPPCKQRDCQEYSWKCETKSEIKPPLHFGGSRRGDQTLLGGCCDGKQDTGDGQYMCAESRVDKHGNDAVIGSSVCPAGNKDSDFVFKYKNTSTGEDIIKTVKYVPETDRIISPDKNAYCGCPPGSTDGSDNVEACGISTQQNVIKIDELGFCENCPANSEAGCCNELDLEYYPDNMLKLRTSDMVWGDDMGAGAAKDRGDKEVQHFESARQRIGFKSYVGEGHTVDYTKEFRPPHGGPYIRTSTHNNRNYPVPEGFWFMEEFSDTHHDNTYDKIMGKVPGDSNDLTEMCVDQGDQFPLYRQFKMPYAKWLDSPGLSYDALDNMRGSTKSTKRQDLGEPRVSCKGYQDTIVGVGNERDNCGYGGWEELKLYQHRCFRYFGISCICDYDKTFKIGSAEDYVLRKAGGVPVFTVSKLTQHDKVRTESSVPAPQPAAWRGYVSEPDPENRFPAYDLAKSYGYTSSNKDVLKMLVKEGIIELGLSKARVGDILIWDRDVLWTSDGNDCMKGSETLTCKPEEIDLIIKARSDALNMSGTHKTIPLKNSRLPHVAYVINARTKSSVAANKENELSIQNVSSCVKGANGMLSGCAEHEFRLQSIKIDEDLIKDGGEFVEISEMNNGKNPDICGNTDRWGREGVRKLFKSRPATTTPEDLMQAGGDCAEPSLRQCTESLWDRVKVYHIQREIEKRHSLQKAP